MPELHAIEPLHLEGLADYHIHCDYSVDAVGSVDDYCEAALRRGLAEICFTTHYDSNPNSEGEPEYIVVKGQKLPTCPESLALYVDDVRRAAEKYLVLGLSVKLGLEFSWYENCEEHVQSLTERYDFDHMLCGIHELDNICFCCHTSFERCFTRYNAEETARLYSDQVVRAARSRLFDAIAHLDYVRKYGAKYYGPPLDLALDRYVPEVLAALKHTGTALEINTAGLRQNIGSYYPKMETINAAMREDVEVSYLGSDAHQPDQVGYDFDAAGVLIPGPIGGCESL